MRATLPKPMRVCAKCRTHKPIADFRQIVHLNRGRVRVPHGWAPVCRECEGRA